MKIKNYIVKITSSIFDVYKNFYILFFLILLTNCSLFINNYDSSNSDSLNNSIELSINGVKYNSNDKYDFGKLENNNKIELEISIKNTSAATLSLKNIEFSGDDADQFYFTDYPTALQNLPYNNTIILHLTFDATRLGNLSAFLNVNSTDYEESIYKLNLIAEVSLKEINDFQVLINNSNIKNNDFLYLGSISKNTLNRYKLTIVNNGNISLTIFSITTLGTSFISIKNEITGYEITPGGFLEVEIEFYPLWASNKIESKLTILTSSKNSSTYIINLEGNSF